MLRHVPVNDAGNENEEAPPPSFLMTDKTFDEGYECSFWVRPQSSDDGSESTYIGLVLVASGNDDNPLTQYLMVRLDLVAGRISLVQKQLADEPMLVTKIEKRFSVVIPAQEYAKRFCVNDFAALVAELKEQKA